MEILILGGCALVAWLLDLAIVRPALRALGF